MARRDRGELTYRDQHDGNPYYEYSAGWHFKCRRCRERTRGDSYFPWYRVLGWAIRYGASDAWFDLEYWIGGSLEKRQEGKSYMRLARRYWPVVVLAAAVSWAGKALTYFTMHPGRAPLHWLNTLLLDAEYHLMGYLENRVERFRWIPPRPELENSIGFWIGEGGNLDMTITMQSFPPRAAVRGAV